ncbi:serine/threonine protein kinase [Arthrobacter sp. UKPF54-2]|uniref:serine/threonine-protein kinase n=1 Tax=Arthrobacter sp. UKPF54-2 TaxID=2600159 RepID=UPI0011B1ABF2|nr:serine/threonine-protein kinase [Arthrobacter sp. UKPF54-2]QDY90042.1 serine/threonine protein kinase [Arthrobacter sp. UKPF54-2]
MTLALTRRPARAAAPRAAFFGPLAEDRLLDQRYRLGTLAGRGSEADVYRATDAANGSEVAVKIFRSDASDAASPFSREKDLHTPLHHRHIVRVNGYGHGPDDGGSGSGRNYLVTELVSGPDLRTVLQDGPLRMPLVAAWMGDVAGALAHVHRKGVVHNDVKPANILVDRSASAGPAGLAKLTDFGIATSSWHRPNHAGSGTPHYLSPEAVHGTTTTTASDVYALGLVTFECLTGIKAFPGPALESMVARTLRAPRLPDTVRRRWSMLLHSMTDAEPGNRPTAAEAHRALKRISR